MVLPPDQERVARPRRRAAVRAAAPGSRAPLCMQTPACPRSQPRDRDELQGLREEEAAAAVQAEAPGREGYGAGELPAPRGHGPRGAPSPTHVEAPAPPPRGQDPRPPLRSRLAPPNRLPQRPLPLSGQPVQTNGIAWAVRILANR